MQKQDLMFFVSAIIIVIVLALVVKPIMNGETVQILPETKSDTVSNIPIPQGAQTTPYSPVMSGTTVAPTSTPAWDGSAKTVQFVDPSTYNLQWPSDVRDFGFRMPGYEQPEDNTLETYATIEGRWDATTQIINIPFPYWEIEVTIESLGDVGSTDFTTTINYSLRIDQLKEEYNSGAITLQQYNERKKILEAAEAQSGGGGSAGGVEGIMGSQGSSTGVDTSSQYYVIPSINVQVMDADKPNGIVYILNSRTQGPLPKVIDKAEGSSSEDFFAEPEDVESGGDKETTGTGPSRENLNEYLWNHAFYEGAGNYYFIINPNMLSSYKIDINVPKKYLMSDV